MEQIPKLPLNQLITFYWVSQLRSFSKAARRLAFPKSTVSQQIRALESRLGARLLERTTRRIGLTEIGEALFGHTERIVRELEEAETLVASHQRTPSGLLRVSIPVTFSRFFLAPVLPSFCQKYPEIDLEFTLSRGNVDLVAEGLDAAILIGTQPDSMHIARKLGSFRRGLFTSHAYLASHPAPELPEHLAMHDIISMNRSSKGCTWKLTTARGRVQEVILEPRIAVADPVLAENLASAGVGIAVLPLFLTLENHQLVRILPDWSPSPVDVFALYPSRQSMTPKLAVFLNELESRLTLPTDLPPAGHS